MTTTAPARRLVLATGNRGKIRELRDLLSDQRIEVFAQSDFDVGPVEETGLTFIENALLKARHASGQTGLAAIADDSGLVVDGLGGRPGIHSARFAGENASDADNVSLLLDELAGVPPERRTAYFFCAMVMVRWPEDPTPLVCEGRWQGHIADAPRGSGGFGYDPVFITESGRTSAELAPEEKNRLSHRGLAVRALVARLPVWWPAT